MLQLLENWKITLESGAIVQIRIWRLEVQTVERPHGLKYSLFYGRPGERIVGYDNETGKGVTGTIGIGKSLIGSQRSRGCSPISGMM